MVNRISYGITRKSGYVHWILHRITSVILLCLFSVLFISIFKDYPSGTVFAFKGILVVSVLHMYLGFGEVIRDYVHNLNTHLLSMVLYNCIMISVIQYLIVLYLGVNAFR